MPDSDPVALLCAPAAAGQIAAAAMIANINPHTLKRISTPPPRLKLQSIEFVSGRASMGAVMERHCFVSGC